MTGDSKTPLIAVAMGDAAGIGPEIVLKALQDEALAARGSFVILGSLPVLEQAAQALGGAGAPWARLRRVETPAEAREAARTAKDGLPVLECEVERNRAFRWGEANAVNGANAVAQIRKAVQLAQAKEVDGVVIAPLNKEAMHRAGFKHPDEIAFLAELAGTPVKTVATWNGIYRSSVTGHVPLRAAPDLITPERILATIHNLWETMERLGVKPRRIGVAGLNPHAGEDGAFGDEEIEVIAPTIEAGRAAGFSLSGPHPADTIFLRALRGEFNGIVFHYHDQGNTPMKTAGFGEGVLLYTGLPFPCAGPTHGSAYEIAGKGQANAGSLLSALKLTLDQCGGRG